MSEATPDDVRGVIPLPDSLADSDIQNYLDDAAYDVEQANDTDAMTTEEIRQLEKYLAALKIAQSKGRPIDQGSKESGSITFGGDQIAWLRKEVRKRDPSDSLARIIDSDRHVTSTRSVE